MGDSVKQFLIAIDQLANTLIGGWADETLSSHAYRKHPVIAAVINAIFFWQSDHCFLAYQAEKLRLQQPPELRLP
jgi:hypothetical protein